MSKQPGLKMPPGLESLRGLGLQAYTAVRKVLHLLTELEKEGAEGPRVFVAAQTLRSLEEIATQAALIPFEKELKEWIAATRERIRQGEEGFKTWFESELGRLLHDRFGLQVRGRVPDLSASYYRLKADLERDAVLICYGADEESLAKCKADPSAVAAEINAQQRDLEVNLLPDDAFLARFSEAYDHAAKLRNIDPGGSVPILHVLREFVWSIQSKKFLADPRRDNFRGYSRVNLSYQLYKLLNRRAAHRTMELTGAGDGNGDRRDETLWVPTNADGGGSRYASVSFR